MLSQKNEKQNQLVPSHNSKKIQFILIKMAEANTFFNEENMKVIRNKKIWEKKYVI